MFVLVNLLVPPLSRAALSSSTSGAVERVSGTHKIRAGLSTTIAHESNPPMPLLLNFLLRILS